MKLIIKTLSIITLMSFQLVAGDFTYKTFQEWHNQCKDLPKLRTLDVRSLTNGCMFKNGEDYFNYRKVEFEELKRVITQFCMLMRTSFCNENQWLQDAPPEQDPFFGTDQ